MTFKEIQDRVMDRLNLSSDTARDRIKDFINERVRAAQTSTSLGRVRKTTVTANTVATEPTVTPTGIVKVTTIVIPTLNRPLGERTLDQLRNFDSMNQWSGSPELYAVEKITATGVILRLQPIPDAVYALQIDGIATGTDLVGDSDVPGFPEDFHDAFVFGAMADELDHLEKSDLSLKQEAKSERRIKEARYFIQKSIYLHRGQNDSRPANWEWWFFGSPWVNP